MKLDSQVERALRWYPPQWRERYAEGMRALLEASYEQGAIPWRTRVGLRRAALGEWIRESGAVGVTSTRRDRLRAGSLIVLGGWTLFVVAGAIFAKLAEQWDLSTAPALRTWPRLGYDLVQGGGSLGVAVSVMSAAAAVPLVYGAQRSGRWPEIRGPIRRLLYVMAGLLVTTPILVLWAHHLTGAERGYHVVGLTWALALVVAIGLTSVSAMQLVYRLEPSERLLRAGSFGALVLSGVMCIIAAGTALWWVSEARHAPQFMHNVGGSVFFSGARGAPWPLAMVGLLMILGLVAACLGTLRLRSGLARDGEGVASS